MTKRLPSLQQRRILRRLISHPSSTQAELARLLGVSPQRVCQHLDAMAGHGWLDRGALRVTLEGVDAAGRRVRP